MGPTFPPRRTLLPYMGGCERRRGKVYERLTHKNSDTARYRRYIGSALTLRHLGTG